MENNQIKILAFAGSTRIESYNEKLIRLAVKALPEWATVTHVSLRDFPAPIYNGDLEEIEGIPKQMRELRKIIRSNDGLLISSPEYNSSIPALLKNAIDWVSRPDESSPELSALRGKVVGLMSASPSRLGGLRGLYQLRSLLMNIQVNVVPEMLTVARADAAFDIHNQLKDEQIKARLQRLVCHTAEVAQSLRPSADCDRKTG